MKIFFTLALLLISSSLYAGLSYDITIDKNGYALTMDMNFSKGHKLQEIKWALKNGDLLSILSPNVVSITNIPIVNSTNYHSLMVVKSFGIYSQLLSMCEEKSHDDSWTRVCSLQTNQYEGGKYMLWKGDEVECLDKNDEVRCHFLIKGQAKPVRILGIQIVSAEVFSIKAKIQALMNFFKLYLYMNEYNLSPKLALESYEHSALQEELKLLEKEGTSSIKSSALYHHSFVLKE